MAYFYLEITRGIDSGARHELPLGPAGIGRHPENTVVLNKVEKTVSAHHAILYVSPDRFVLQDMRSTNGTFVNERHVEQEQELRPGDEIGFGKKGPRLKLVVSPVKLSPTADRGPEPQAETATGPRSEHGAAPQAPHQAASLTDEYARKLHEHRLDSAELHRLMGNGKRVQRLLRRPSIPDGQKRMLDSMYGAQRLARRRWLVVVGLLAALSLGLTTYFTLRLRHYREQLLEAHRAEEQLDICEKRLMEARSGRGREDVRRLAGEFEQQRSLFASLRAQVNGTDFRKYYSDPIERDLDAIMARFGEQDYHIPTDMLERVRYYVGLYCGRLRPNVSEYLKREERYFPMIRRALKDAFLPEQLAYVAMLESGLDPNAVSHAGAGGLWQLMPSTARTYHLRVDTTTDERLDPEKATKAAAAYMKDLIAIFGASRSVMLAMAAYNAGEGRLMEALKRIDDPMHNRDFWYIYRMGILAEETNEYIPRVLALMIVDGNRGEYGFGAVR